MSFFSLYLETLAPRILTRFKAFDRHRGFLITLAITGPRRLIVHFETARLRGSVCIALLCGMFEHQRDLFDDRPPKVLTWRERYNAVIASKRWRRLRAKRLDKCNHSCERCGWKKETWDKSRTLDLHHRTYERLGHERDDDLEMVCSVCHEKADRERAAEGRRRAANALYDAQFDGWATKVYGEDYGMFEDEDMHDRFCEWQERKEMEDW